ncbi:acetate/propionate family kinase [Aureliella helgolandensis]|uniref:Acetate kinase n=1 Tax=Aureliella helgolandensis TaxID=2527968 RepID=A0A518G051_9BACT|nr:acetate/propionate family kinase [Aureliella helgolandensis]QDV21987.1 Acetate kinase [Aureliella helgolandensis]
MKVLVANLGSTSFKYRLFDMTPELSGQPAQQLARGGVERIGSPSSPCSVEIGEFQGKMELEVPHHGVAVRACIQQLTDPDNGCLTGPEEIAAIGFKAVHGGRFQGVFRINDEVLDAMEEVSSVAPAHNPPYLAAMRLLASTVPDIALVAAFETDFHQTIPAARHHYALPKAWAEALPIRKWGFHGASHRYIATRSAEILKRSDARVISCHLGGSSSLCAIQSGKSVATTMGMSPQTGLPQNNRVGDLDPFCLPMLMQHTGKNLEEILAALSSEAGLLGLSGGISGDIRDLESAAQNGNADAQLALDVYVAEIRRQFGGMLVALGGCDALVFTGGIGENGASIRTAVCAGLQELGLALDEPKNAATRSSETRIDDGTNRTQIWVLPTNEELIVARQTVAALA